MDKSYKGIPYLTFDNNIKEINHDNEQKRRLGASSAVCVFEARSYH